MRLHNRQIKAGWWTDGELLRWPLDKRVFYLGLIQIADDSGCVDHDPFTFKMMIFPSPLDVLITVELLSQYSEELRECGKLLPYESSGKTYFYIMNFHKHQKLRNPGESSVPLPEWVTFTPSEVAQRGGVYSVNDTLLLQYQEILEAKRREGKVRDTVTVPLQYCENREEVPDSLFADEEKKRREETKRQADEVKAVRKAHDKQVLADFDEWYDTVYGNKSGRAKAWEVYPHWHEQYGRDGIVDATRAYHAWCDTFTPPRTLKDAATFLSLKQKNVPEFFEKAKSGVIEKPREKQTPNAAGGKWDGITYD
jgi:hypothetical protein